MLKYKNSFRILWSINMRKVPEPEKKLIASLVASGRAIEYIKDRYKVAER